MSSYAVETGWQRFLDRLKQLWGRVGQGGKLPAAGISSAPAMSGTAP